MPGIRIKRGASLELSFTFKEADGSATPLAGKTLRAQVRDVSWSLLADLSLVAGNAANERTAVVDDTSSWPEGAARCDIAVIDGDGIVTISDTFAIQVDRAVTEVGD